MIDERGVFLISETQRPSWTLFDNRVRRNPCPGRTMKKHGSVGEYPRCRGGQQGSRSARGRRLASPENQEDLVPRAVGRRKRRPMAFRRCPSHCDVMKLRRLWRIAEEYADHGSDPGGVLAALPRMSTGNRSCRGRDTCAAGERRLVRAQDPAREAARIVPRDRCGCLVPGLDPGCRRLPRREVSPRERIVQAEPDPESGRRSPGGARAAGRSPQKPRPKPWVPARTDEVLMAALADGTSCVPPGDRRRAV